MSHTNKLRPRAAHDAGRTLLLCIAALALACNSPKEAEVHEEKTGTAHPASVRLTRAQFERVGIELGATEEKNLREIVRANGFLKVPPQNQADVSASIGGLVDAIVAREGDFVRSGDTLAWLRHPDYIRMQEDFVASKYRLSILESDFRRLRQLGDQNLESEQSVRTKQSEMETEKARWASLRMQLDMIHVSTADLEKGRMVAVVPLLSPIGGYVAHIAATIGMYAEVSKPLFQIVDNSHIHVDLLVYEKDLFKIKMGQTVHFVLTNQANREIDGVVFSVGKAFENETKSVAVHADILDGRQYGLIPGMFVNALIDVGSRKTSCVPSEAVVDLDGRSFLFRLTEEHADDREFMPVEVVTGVTDLGFTEITPVVDVPAHSRIVIRGAFFLVSKLKSDESGDDHGH